jgi:hypothetical protein
VAGDQRKVGQVLPLEAPTHPERRAAPRYPARTGIFASLDGHTVRLRNISLSGVAIQGSGPATGGRHLLELHLDRRHIGLWVEILDCSGSGLLHARFVDPNRRARDLIRDYIATLA